MTSRRPILILDDDPDVLRLVSTVLARDGHEVLTAASPIDALALARKRSPEVLLVDLMLPHMDGEAFLAELRREPPSEPAKIVIISASAMRDDMAERDDVHAVLSKPFELEDLRTLVAKLVG